MWKLTHRLKFECLRFVLLLFVCVCVSLGGSSEEFHLQKLQEKLQRNPHHRCKHGHCWDLRDGLGPASGGFCITLNPNRSLITSDIYRVQGGQPTLPLFLLQLVECTIILLFHSVLKNEDLRLTRTCLKTWIAPDFCEWQTLDFFFRTIQV